MIELRAWDNDEKFWIHPTSLYITSSGDVVCPLSEDAEDPMVPLVNVTLERWIGLTDKNGVRVFEGDILDMYEISFEFGEQITNKIRCEVKFSNGEFTAGPQSLRQFYTAGVEVIGNIHEHKHLLEVA